MPSFTTATILMISVWNASQKSPSGIFQIWVNVPLPFGWLQTPPLSLFSIIQNDTSTRRSSWKGVYCNMLWYVQLTPPPTPPHPPPCLTGWNYVSGKWFLEGHMLRKGKYITILVLFVQRKPAAKTFG